MVQRVALSHSCRYERLQFGQCSLHHTRNVHEMESATFLHEMSMRWKVLLFSEMQKKEKSTKKRAQHICYLLRVELCQFAQLFITYDYTSTGQVILCQVTKIELYLKTVCRTYIYESVIECGFLGISGFYTHLISIVQCTQGICFHRYRVETYKWADLKVYKIKLYVYSPISLKRL